MQKLKDLQPKRVFKYFEELTAIPRGSGDMERVSGYCVEFAKKLGLDAVRDAANNVVIKKPARKGYENAEAVILQGHLDMVCQKDEGVSIDFLKDGLDIFVDGDLVGARGTTLGADNGIGVAMIMAVLESDDIAHPAIEAVFTTDEEIGMIGAGRLCFDDLKARKMINLDTETPEVITVSCAGGTDFSVTIPVTRHKKEGTHVTVVLKGLSGGHSGVDINKGRQNANSLMARILISAKGVCDFSIVSIDGGDKGNAIPVSSTARLVTDEPDRLVKALREYIDTVKDELAECESGFAASVEAGEKGVFDVLESPDTEKIIGMLLSAPNGVIDMSSEIEGLVETSLNLGILKTENDKISLLFTLRSNKKSGLVSLEEELRNYFSCVDCTIETSGHYPPWEYKDNSALQAIYKGKFFDKFGYEPGVEAIHAGLECGVFASNIKDLDCISVGAKTYDIHTTKERLSISSTKDMFELLKSVLSDCK